MAITLGSNTHQYELVEGWAKLPEGVTLGYTHGVEIDSKDNVIVFNQSKDAIIFFDSEGNYIKSWGAEYEEGAHGLYLSNEGGVEYLYLSDNNLHTVTKTTLDGEVLFTITTPDLPLVYQSADQFVPTDVAVAPNGDFYVADGYGQPWVHQYNNTGEYLRSFGGFGDGKGQLNCPHGVWVDTRGDSPVLLVADRGNHRIQIFTLDGEHLDFVTEDLIQPCCFYQHGDEIYIPDLSSRVTIFDKNNTLITHLGDNPGCCNWSGYPNIAHDKRQSDKFISPHALAVDSTGDIYVVEWVEDGRITKLKRKN